MCSAKPLETHLNTPNVGGLRKPWQFWIFSLLKGILSSVPQDCFFGFSHRTDPMTGPSIIINQPLFLFFFGCLKHCVFDPTTGTIVPIFPRMAPSPAWPTHRVTGQELNAYLKALKPYYYFVELLGVRKLPSCLGVQRNMVLELNVTNESMIN